MPISVDGTNGITFNDSTAFNTAYSLGMRNRIINGNMVIDQRNAGASGTASNYTVDRWGYSATQASKGTWGRNLNSVTPPAGFTNYLGFQSSSAYSVGASDVFYIYQGIEGYNYADLAYGTVNAKTTTFSFWVYSSLTGVFGGAYQNAGGTRTYPFSYTIPAANTWTYITVTIPGDTTGTWNTTNGAANYVNFSLGAGSTYSGSANAWSGSNYFQPTGSTSVVGTSGATFYITGVQLEIGTVATPYERQIYSNQLIQCQRYYQTNGNVTRSQTSSAGVFSYICWNTTMRTAPTVSLTSISYANASGGSVQNTGVNGTEISFAPSAIGGYMFSTILASAEL